MCLICNNSGSVKSLSRLGNPMGCCREINIDWLIEGHFCLYIYHHGTLLPDFKYVFDQLELGVLALWAAWVEFQAADDEYKVCWWLLCSLCTETCFYSCQSPTLKFAYENCDHLHPDENDDDYDCLHILHFGFKGPTWYEKVYEKVQKLEKVHTLDRCIEVLAK